MHPTTDHEAFARRAAEAGVRDMLLLRRVSATSWAHLGGLGRGRGWAGIVSVSQDEAGARLPEAGRMRRLIFSEPSCVLGPYYARCAVIVRSSSDVAVVLGSDDPVRLSRCRDADLLALATDLEQAIDDVAPAKRLADELEVLNAVRDVLATPATTVPATLTHITEVAVRALSCDLGFLVDGAGNQTVVGGNAADPPDALAPALGELATRAGGSLLCLQDVTGEPDVALLTVYPEIRSLLVLPLPAPVGGVLVTAHTAAGPRGFTSLCQHLGQQVVDAGSVLAQTAAAREELQRLADQQQHAARTDILTGLGNRLRWEEALTAAQRRLDGGQPVTVIAIDLDGLKLVNDRSGHDAGDALLRRCADIIRQHCRDTDVAARLGGDEFALLLPVDETTADARVETLVAALSGVGGQPAASVGAAHAVAGQHLADAVRLADIRMYAVKDQRRSRATIAAA